MPIPDPAGCLRSHSEISTCPVWSAQSAAVPLTYPSGLATVQSHPPSTSACAEVGVARVGRSLPCLCSPGTGARRRGGAGGGGGEGAAAGRAGGGGGEGAATGRVRGGCGRRLDAVEVVVLGGVVQRGLALLVDVVGVGARSQAEDAALCVPAEGGGVEERGARGGTRTPQGRGARSATRA